MRLCVIMSPESELSRSTPSAGAAPRSRSRPVIGWPWPWHISFSAVDGEADPEIDEAAQPLVGEIVAVDDIDVVADQALLLQNIPPSRRLGGAAALVHRSDETEFTRQPEIVQRDLERRIMRTEDREAERHLALARRERAGEQALDLAPWMRNF